MSNILQDYYLDSLDKLDITERLYRSDGSSQVHIWQKPDEPQPQNTITFRQYYRGFHNGEEFFAKQFIEPYPPTWSVQNCTKYQAENLLLFKNLHCTPNLLFYTDDTVGMEFIDGETAKNLYLSSQLSVSACDKILATMKTYGYFIIEQLTKRNRKYDCSYNNILVTDKEDVYFVDFDYADRFRFGQTMSIIIGLRNQISQGTYH